MVIITRDGRGRGITIGSRLTTPSPQATMMPVMMMVVVVRCASIINIVVCGFGRHFNEIHTLNVILTTEPRLTQSLYRTEQVPAAILFEGMRTIAISGQEMVNYAL
jgi:hypothetical protein